jgi:hypothetical protein
MQTTSTFPTRPGNCTPASWTAGSSPSNPAWSPMLTAGPAMPVPGFLYTIVREEPHHIFSGLFFLAPVDLSELHGCVDDSAIKHIYRPADTSPFRPGDQLLYLCTGSLSGQPGIRASILPKGFPRPHDFFTGTTSMFPTGTVHRLHGRLDRLPPVRQVTDAKILEGCRRARDTITAWIDRTLGAGIPG